MVYSKTETLQRWGLPSKADEGAASKHFYSGTSSVSMLTPRFWVMAQLALSLLPNDP